MTKVPKILALAALAAVALPLARAQKNPYSGDVPYSPKPAFPGQTRAPLPSTPSPDVKVETITTRLTSPWSEVLLPDGNFLVTESIGSMRIVRPDGVVSAPLAGLPGVKVVAAQGLHDIVLDPGFARNRIVYFTYFAPPPGEAPAIWPTEFFYQNVWTKSLAERRTMRIGMERMARAHLSDDERSLENVETLVEGAERRIVFAPDGTILITGADRFRFYDSKYDGVEHAFTDNPDLLRNFTGRVLRINRDGSIPKDNPWLGRATVAASTYAHGLRDPEGAAINPATGELWVTDHGPQGGDEIDIIRAGHDYGWPNVSYGVQYDFQRTDGRKNVPVGTGRTSMSGVDEPAYFWNPDIAPSGMLFYTGDVFPQWKGNLFIGGMQARALVRLVLNGDHITAEEHLLAGRNLRVRDIKQAPDGSIYLLAGDALLHLMPK
ncbi:MAG TPA: PQQ-dependent sugar dehydrogenase [Bryobacteraceae bacterium]|nr:PQQ-dependent sugar dehydrogenase [Bryobacteraceae bacterium]